MEAGHCALASLVKGYDYEITAADVRMAYSAAMNAAQALGHAAETKERIRRLVGAAAADDFAANVLRHELGPS
jgi:hypothetical protein